MRESIVFPSPSPRFARGKLTLWMRGTRLRALVPAIATAKPSPAPGPVPWRILLVAFALGMLVRVVAFEALQYSFDTGDAVTYQGIGRNLAAHGAYSLDYSQPLTPTVLRPPLLPFLFSLTLRCFGDTYMALQLVQAALNVGACVLLFLAVRRYSSMLAMVVLGLGIFSPFDAAFSGALLTESLCGSLLVAAFAVPLLIRSQATWLLSGALVGAAALTKDVYLGLIVFVPVLLIIFGVPGDTVPRRRAALLFVLAMMMVVTPWTLRNYRVRHQFIAVSAGNLGMGLYYGTWMPHFTNVDDSDYYRFEYGDFADRAQVEAAGDLQQERARDAAYLAVVGRRVRAKPLLVLRTWLARTWQLWLGNRLPFDLRFNAKGTRVWTVTKYGLAVLNVLLVALGGAGLWMALRCRSPLSWLAAPIIYTALAYLPFVPEVRHSQPVFLLLLAFAAMAMTRLHSRHESEERPA